MRFLRPETQKSAMGPECFCRQCFFSHFEGHFREKCVSGLIFRFWVQKVGPDPTFAFFRAKSVPGRPGRPQGGIGTPESLIFLGNYWCFGPGRVGMRFFCHFHPKITFSFHFTKFPPKWKNGAHFAPKAVLEAKRGQGDYRLFRTAVDNSDVPEM